MAKVDLETQGSSGMDRVSRTRNGRLAADSNGSLGPERPELDRSVRERRGKPRRGPETSGSRAMAAQGSVSRGKSRVGAGRNGSAAPDGSGVAGLGEKRPTLARQAKGRGSATAPAELTDAEIDTKAERLRPVMEALAQRGEGGSSRALVEAARDPSSPIHDCFEWNDSVAGERWRVYVANKYWGGIKIEIETPSGPVKAPAFIPIVVGDEQSYRPVHEVAARADWREQMIAQATRELESWRKRYDAISAVASVRPVFDAIARVTRKRKAA